MFWRWRSCRPRPRTIITRRTPPPSGGSSEGPAKKLACAGADGGRRGRSRGPSSAMRRVSCRLSWFAGLPALFGASPIIARHPNMHACMPFPCGPCSSASPKSSQLIHIPFLFIKIYSCQFIFINSLSRRRRTIRSGGHGPGVRCVLPERVRPAGLRLPIVQRVRSWSLLHADQHLW